MENPLFRDLQYRYRYLKTNMTATNAASKKMQQKFKWNLLNSLPTWVPLRRSTKTQAEWAGQGIFRSARQPESWLPRSQDVNVRGLPSTTTKLAFTRNFIINKYPNTTILRLAWSRGCRWNQREEKRLNSLLYCYRLKRQCQEISCFRFFSWIIFPQAPENNIRIISNVFENVQRLSQVKVLSSKGAPRVANNGNNISLVTP